MNEREDCPDCLIGIKPSGKPCETCDGSGSISSPVDEDDDFDREPLDKYERAEMMADHRNNLRGNR